MILIGAGHYPTEPGAVFPPSGTLSNSFVEHDVAASWVPLIAQKIEDYIPVAIVSPQWLGGKVRFINEYVGVESVHLTAELHFNSDPSHKGRGCETLYCPRSVKGKRAAETMQRYLGSLITPDRGAKEGWYRMDLPGHVDYPGDVEGDEKIDYYLKVTNMTALIIEPEFLHNRITIERIKDAACKTIAQALIVAHQEIKDGPSH